MSSSDWSSRFRFVPPFPVSDGELSDYFPREFHILVTWGCWQVYEDLLADARRAADAVLSNRLAPLVGDAAKPFATPIRYIEHQQGRVEYLLERLLDQPSGQVVPVVGRERFLCDYDRRRFVFEQFPILMSGKVEKGKKPLSPFGAAIATALARKPGVIQSTAEILAYIDRLPSIHLADEATKFSGNVDHVRKAFSDQTGIDKSVFTDNIFQCVDRRQGQWRLNLTPQEVRFVPPTLMPTPASSRRGT